MNIKDSKTKTVLKYLAVGGGIAVLSMVSPLLPMSLMKAYSRNKKFQRNLFLRDLKRLQQRDMVDLKELEDGLVKVVLKEQGEQKTLQYKLDGMEIKKPSKWDKKWRLVMFDIPESKKQARDALRRKLKEIGFYQLQKSAFICPYPCESEIDFIGLFFDIRDNILIIQVSYFDGEEKLKQYFSIV